MSIKISKACYRNSKGLLVSVSLLFTAAAVGGCSNLTRFDFPIFGLEKEEKSTASIQSEYGVNRVYPPLNEEERARAGQNGYYSGMYGSGRERRSEVTRSDLPALSSSGENGYRTSSSSGYSGYGNNSYRSDSYSSGSDYRDSRESGGSSYRERSRDYEDTGRYRSQSTRSAGTIVVRRGDTLYSLARNNNVDLHDLKEANGLNDNIIHVGQELIIPSGGGSRDTYRPVSRSYAGNGVSRDRYESAEREYRYSRERNNSGYRSGGYRSEETEYKPVKRAEPRRNDKLAYNGRSEVQTDNRPIGPTRPAKLKEHSVTREPEVVNERNRVEQDRAVQRQSEPVRQQPEEKEQKTALLREKPEEARREPEPQQRSEAEEIEMPKTSGRFRWPVRGRIISQFGAKRNGARNDGINLSVPFGTDVKAAESGEVAYAGNELKGYGNLVLIRHRDKWVSAYAHNSEILVRRGQRVRRGQVIAKAGKSGSVTQPQVHFELRKEAKPVDPLKYM